MSPLLTRRQRLHCASLFQNCPRLVHNTDQNEILIPVGHSVPIRIDARNLPNIRVSRGLRGPNATDCIFLEKDTRDSHVQNKFRFKDYTFKL